MHEDAPIRLEALVLFESEHGLCAPKLVDEPAPQAQAGRPSLPVSPFERACTGRQTP